MARTSRSSHRRWFVRPPGLLLAEVALTLVLISGLLLFWPASAPTGAALDSELTFPPTSARLLQGADDRPGMRATALAAMPMVPPSAQPIQLLISSVNLHPRVESVGLDRLGAMDVPRNYWNVGWYNGGPVPGDPGDAVIDGHAGYPTEPLVFARLAKIRSGDKIVVVLAGGSRRNFTVDSVKTWPAFAHPTGLFDPSGPPRLTLITCTGQFNGKSYAYKDRLVVEASFAGSE